MKCEVYGGSSKGLEKMIAIGSSPLVEGYPKNHRRRGFFRVCIGTWVNSGNSQEFLANIQEFWYEFNKITMNLSAISGGIRKPHSFLNLFHKKNLCDAGRAGINFLEID